MLARGGGESEAAAAAAAAVFAAEQQQQQDRSSRGDRSHRSGEHSSRRHERERERERAPSRPKPPGVPDLSADDYFARSGEFAAWLLEAKGSYASELESDRARALFLEFADEWNSGRLRSRYYEGLVKAPAKRTAHAWGFAASGGAGGGGGGGTGGMAALLEDRQAARKDARAAEGADRRRWRAEQREALDEMLPKSTGREALVEKRIARREAARARDDSPEMMHVAGGGGSVMGGDDSFAAAKAR